MGYIALAAHWFQRAFRGIRTPVRTWSLGVVPLIAIAAVEGWQRVVAARSTEFPATVDTRQVQNLPDPRGHSFFRPLIQEWWHFWPGGLSGDQLGFGSWELVVATAAVMLAAGAIGIALLSADPSPVARSLAIGVLVGGPITAWASERVFAFAVPARYGASVIGLALLIVALTVARRPSRALLVLSVVLWAAAFLVRWP
jgi:hypothetical protein